MIMFLIKIIYAILFILMWAGIIKYRRTVKSWTWNFYWAEKYIWNWWTYLVLILAWMLLIFYWTIYPFWWIDLLLKK